MVYCYCTPLTDKGHFPCWPHKGDVCFNMTYYDTVTEKTPHMGIHLLYRLPYSIYHIILHLSSLVYSGTFKKGSVILLRPKQRCLWLNCWFIHIWQWISSMKVNVTALEGRTLRWMIDMKGPDQASIIDKTDVAAFSLQSNWSIYTGGESELFC